MGRPLAVYIWAIEDLVTAEIFRWIKKEYERQHPNHDRIQDTNFSSSRNVLIVHYLSRVLAGNSKIKT
jgi:hypothetical protein